MKKIILLVLLVASWNFASAQYALPKGKAQFNAGLGLSSWGIPVYAGFDVGVHRDISVGGELSFRSHNDHNNGNGNDNHHHNVIGLSGNGNYHFNTLLNMPTTWDFYAGLNLGFYFWSDDDLDDNDDGTSGLSLGAQVGGRYYFTDRFGINLELGTASAFSSGKFGITLKL